MNKLPDVIRVLTQRALIGCVTRRMRTIAVAIDKDVITLRFYIDRPPTELDIKDAEYICNKLEKLLVEAQSEIEIARHMCLFSDLPKGKIDTFDGSIYSRNEDTWVDSDPW